MIRSTQQGSCEHIMIGKQYEEASKDKNQQKLSVFLLGWHNFKWMEQIGLPSFEGEQIDWKDSLLDLQTFSMWLSNCILREYMCYLGHTGALLIYVTYTYSHYMFVCGCMWSITDWPRSQGPDWILSLHRVFEGNWVHIVQWCSHMLMFSGTIPESLGFCMICK